MRPALLALLLAATVLQNDVERVRFTTAVSAEELGIEPKRANGLEGDSIPRELTGRAVDIDGDTLRVAGTKIRLCGIDSAEVSTPAGREARRIMRRLVDGRSVTCRIVGNGTPCDRRSSPTSYDRLVAQCFLAGRDLAAIAVRLGIAEDWPRYSGGFYAR